MQCTYKLRLEAREKKKYNKEVLIMNRLQTTIYKQKLK